MDNGFRLDVPVLLIGFNRPDLIAQGIENLRQQNVVIVADEEADIVRSRLFRFMKRHKGLVSSIETISRSLIK